MTEFARNPDGSIPLSVTRGIDPGPWRDARVARAIFGETVTVSWCATSGCIDIPYKIGDPDPDVMAIWKHPDYGRTWVSCPKYSTDIKAAFDAANRVGLFDDPMIALRGSKGLGWFVNNVQPGGWTLLGVGETPEDAICSAILELHG